MSRWISRFRTATAIAGTAACISLAAPHAEANSWWNFQKVVNSEDAMPGTDPERIFNSFNPPSIDENQLVVFRGRTRGVGHGPLDPGQLEGIYTRDMAILGPINLIADSNTPVPDSELADVTFRRFPSFPRIDDGSVVFRGMSPPIVPEGGGNAGVYTNAPGVLTTGVNRTFTVPPDNTVVFGQFPGAPDIVDGTIIFKGNLSEEEEGGDEATGIYFRDVVNDGPVQLVTGTNQNIPGTTTPFGSTSPPSVDENLVAFRGVDDEENPTLGGLMLADRSAADIPFSVQSLVSIGDSIPNGTGAFARIGEAISFDGGTIAFNAYSDSGEQGIYQYDVDTDDLSTVADLETLIPGSSDTFTSFEFESIRMGGENEGELRISSFLAADSEVVAFLGKGPDDLVGLYALIDDTLTKILDTTDNAGLLEPELDGFLITELGLERDGLAGGTLAFSARMEDPDGILEGRAGIYTVPIPEPTTAALVVLAATFAGSRRPRRHHA
ncbi:MAG: PEP-CTERM sorting domain-containing protein [Phycisphaeraceae bacterium]